MTRCHQIPAHVVSSRQSPTGALLSSKQPSSKLPNPDELPVVLQLRHALQPKLRMQQGRTLKQTAAVSTAAEAPCFRVAALHPPGYICPTLYPATFFGVHCQYLTSRNM